MSRVLCFAAHPDDEVLGVGGTLLRHMAAGDDVHVYIARECRPDGLDEAVEAQIRMGIVYTMPDPDLGLGGVDGFVEAFRPDIVYTHSLADLHADHRALHERVMVACRPSSGVKAIYAFETPSATDWGLVPFTPQRYVDISDTLEQKLHAMSAYSSELREYPHPRNLKSLTIRAQYWGQRSGLGAAEAFEVIRECW